MKIRLGYACISKTLSNVTTSSTITYTTFQKDKDYKKIDTAIKSNLNALKEILTYNIKNNIHFYLLFHNRLEKFAGFPNCSACKFLLH